MQFAFRDSRLVAHDEDGGSVVRLETSKGDYELDTRSFTQTDGNAVFRRILNPEVPTNSVTHVSYLRPEKVAVLHDSPSHFGRGVDAQLLSRCTSLNAQALRWMVSTSPEGVLWPENEDGNWVRAAVSSKADIVAIPSRPHERASRIIARMNRALQLMESFPDDYQKEVVPTIRLDHNRFLESFSTLVGAGFPALVLEFHGITKWVGNLSGAFEMLRKAAKPPYILGTNVPRRELRASGSGTLVATRFGVQACAPSIFHGRVDDAEDEEERKASQLWWNHQPFGGYVRARDLPDRFGAGCACPDHQAATRHIAEGAPLAERLDARRRHETWSHLMESSIMADAVRRDGFADYLELRPFLARSLRPTREG